MERASTGAAKIPDHRGTDYIFRVVNLLLEESWKTARTNERGHEEALERNERER